MYLIVLRKSRSSVESEDSKERENWSFGVDGRTLIEEIIYSLGSAQHNYILASSFEVDNVT